VREARFWYKSFVIGRDPGFGGIVDIRSRRHLEVHDTHYIESTASRNVAVKVRRVRFQDIGCLWKAQGRDTLGGVALNRRQRRRHAFVHVRNEWAAPACPGQG
jgi:hypothetical protein